MAKKFSKKSSKAFGGRFEQSKIIIKVQDTKGGAYRIYDTYTDIRIATEVANDLKNKCGYADVLMEF